MSELEQFIAEEAVQKTENKKVLEVESLQKKFKIVEDPDSNNDSQSKQNIEPEIAQHTERESKNIRRVNLPFIQVLH